ncbi:MAG: 30S ribosomal protein S19e [Candidatus Micrarchaeota archaeon]
MVSKSLEVTANKLIAATAEQLKSMPEIKPPEWVAMVKSGSHNERIPSEDDFWFKRCASILRQLLTTDRKSLGVRRLQHKYGGRTSNTVSRSHHRKAGGKIIRVAMQQLEKAGLIKKQKVGRVITDAGKKLLEKSAKAVAA